MELDIDNSRLIVGKKILDTRNEVKYLVCTNGSYKIH